jgi:hypothetical protein
MESMSAFSSKHKVFSAQPLVELVEVIDDNIENLPHSGYFKSWYGNIYQELSGLRDLALDQLSDVNRQMLLLDHYFISRYEHILNRVKSSGLSNFLRHWQIDLKQAPSDTDYLEEDIKELRSWLEEHGMVRLESSI